MLKIIKNIWSVSILKTLMFNFKYFHYKIAIQFPVIVCNNVLLKNLKGTVELKENPKFRTIIIGYSFYGDLTKNDKLIWNQTGGHVKLSNNILIGQGTYVQIGKKGSLEIGDNVVFGGGKNAKIITFNKICINRNSRLAWNAELCDTSFHQLINYETGEQNMINGTIHIGETNWIGNNSKIYKNTKTANFSTFGANSLIFRDFGNEEYCVYIGNPLKLVKKGWYRDLSSNEIV